MFSIDRTRLADYQRRVSRVWAAFLPLLLLAILVEFYRADWVVLDFLSAPDAPLKVIRDMLPSLLAAGGAYLLGVQFVVALYELSDRREGADHLKRCMFGQPTKKPTIVASEGKLNVDDNSIFVRVGGPVRVVIHRDTTLVLERGGRLTRVLGPSQTDYLEDYERVREAIDLRPMRWGDYEVQALSKEGIKVKLSAGVSFQIDAGGRPPKPDMPFPAQPEAILKAATCKWMRDPRLDEDDQYFDWVRRVVIGEMEGTLRGIVSRYTLEELIGLEGLSDPGRPNPRVEIRRELERRLRSDVTKLGAQINDVRIGKIQVDDKVTQQWIEVWEDTWRRRASLEERTGEARREQLVEEAKIAAQAEMITDLAMAIQQSAASDVRISWRLLLTQLIEIFDHHSIGPHTYLPTRAMETLSYLRKLVR